MVSDDLGEVLVACRRTGPWAAARTALAIAPLDIAPSPDRQGLGSAC